MSIASSYKTFKAKASEFIDHIHQEGGETKEAFHLLVNSVNDGVELTPEEKHKIGEQLKDVFKTLGMVGIAVLPGGSVFFILAKFFKWNKYIMPSAFETPTINE
jgi:hypothetical protein